jgi:glycosyltransferase involved in cell wall biosynthesis
MKVTFVAIVKNEAHVIARCLASFSDVCDSFCIVDTGSTDDTKEIIEDVLQDVPHRLFNRPWVDFGTNRTEALKLARESFPDADYLLMNDADHIFHGSLPEKLTADGYGIMYHYPPTAYGVMCLFKRDVPWAYKGVLHEYPLIEGVGKLPKQEMLASCHIEVRHEGARSRDPETYKKDAVLLEAALEKEPTNERYVYYLAQSYRDCGEMAKSREMYLKRAAMGGWDQEVWHAKYMAAMIARRLGLPEQEIMLGLLDAYRTRPIRAEPLIHLSHLHRAKEEFHLAFAYALAACYTPAPLDSLFVEPHVYEWQALEEVCISAWYADRKEFGEWAARELAKRSFPPQIRPRIESNLKCYGVLLDKAAA